MSKKILSIFVALMMVVSMFAMTANAANYYYESEEDIAAEKYTQTWALGDPVDNGDGTWSVEVYLTTNYATGAIQFVVTNTDSSVASIDSVEVGDAISYVDEAVFNEDGKIMLVPNTSNDNTIAGYEIDGVIAVITYAYSGEGTVTIAIDNDPKSATNPGGTLIAARTSDGDIVTGSAITGQVVLSTGDEKIIGGAAGEAPALAVIDGTIGVIDTSRTTMGDFDEMEVTGYIYGVEPESYETIDMVFEVVGDGYMSIVANEAGSEAGTGTLVEVYDNNDNLIETYVLVIFGDINGDGFVTAEDSIIGELHDAWMYEDGADGMRICKTEVIFAGDLDVDGDITASDTIDIEFHDAYMYETGADGMRMYQSDVMARL